MKKFVFTKQAKKDLSSLPSEIQKRILDKINSLKTTESVFARIKKLQGVTPASYRLRVGDYRLIMQYESPDIFIISNIGHRKDIYS